MEIRASFDAATLNLAANVANFHGRAWGGRVLGSRGEGEAKNRIGAGV